MKTAFITGANRGLGKGFVEYLLSQGYQVFAGVRDNTSQLEFNKNLIVVKCDISNDEQIDNALNIIRLQTNHLDLIINNAGVNDETLTNNRKHLVSNINNLDRGLVLKMFDINSVSPIFVVKKFLKLLNNTNCFVINISSSRASYQDEYEDGYPNYGYSSSKYALNMMTYRLSKELPTNVQTFSVSAGDVKTDMNQSGEQLPYEQAKNIINITNNWNPKLNGRFLNWDGKQYPL